MSRLLRKRALQASLAIAGASAGVGLVARYNSSKSRLNSLSMNAPTSPTPSTLTTDVLVVGSGGAALTAALRARTAGLSVLVIEKGEVIGGTSAYSGGVLWIPNNGLVPPTPGKESDSPELARTYLDDIIGDVGPASSPARRSAFLAQGPELVRFLSSQGYKWQSSTGYPEYFPGRPGSLEGGGRSIEPGMFDANLLGPWRALLSINPTRPPLPVFSWEVKDMVRARSSWSGRMSVATVFAARGWVPRWVMGKENVTLGVSMISQLLWLNLQAGTSIVTGTALKELVVGEDGRVTGAVVEREGKKVTIEAGRGVVLAAGGFAHNDEMRKKYQAAGITTDWTSTSPGDRGDAIRAAMDIGAATALMDSAWWGAAMVDPESKARFWSLYDRVLPHSMIVDQSGKRHLNESQNYNSLGTLLWNRPIPSYMVIDSTHRKQYVLCNKFMPGITPQSAIDSGFIMKADTIEELAGKMGVPAKALRETVDRFNGFAQKGVDEDFHRGDSAYDKFMGDPTYKNPNLGAIQKGPFYALKVYPGDLGTKGGVLTDEHGRALREKKGWKLSGNGDGTEGYEVIPGLYVAGNSSASVMGRTYAGPGATLGPALTFAYIAAGHIISEGKKAK